MSENDETPRPKIAFALKPEEGPKKVSLGISVPLAVPERAPPPAPPRELPPLPVNDMVQGFMDDDAPGTSYQDEVKDEPAPEGTAQDWKPSPPKPAGEVGSKPPPGAPKMTPSFGFMRDIPEKPEPEKDGG